VTEQLFREDSYLKECDAVVVAVDDDAIVLDRTVFYPMGGGQAADTGSIHWEGGSATVLDTRYGDGGAIRHIVAENAVRPQVGGQVRASIDWDRRYRHMRMHTALHLLGSILKYGVTGGNISAEKSRLDFDMEDTVDKEEVAESLKTLVEENHSISCRWITDEELEAQPDLVRTMSVQPPKGAGKVRLLDIEGVDLQPCGGTKRNRRVNIHLDD
jgi:misacylated tRNA(Ala) deacylase